MAHHVIFHNPHAPPHPTPIIPSLILTLHSHAKKESQRKEFLRREIGGGRERDSLKKHHARNQTETPELRSGFNNLQIIINTRLDHRIDQRWITSPRGLTHWC